MRPSQIRPDRLYAVRPAGRFSPIERLVVRIAPIPAYGVTSVYYRVRIDGRPFSLYLYRCSLKHFAENATRRVPAAASKTCTVGVRRD